jgi:hypothetical protein
MYLMVRRISVKEARDNPFAVLDRTRARNRDKDPDQVHRDVEAAVAEVRATSRRKSRKRA